MGNRIIKMNRCDVKESIKDKLIYGDEVISMQISKIETASNK